ncbi:MAG: ferrous iron transport protein A [Spirochaetaceae bacterium]|nr:ferrous iron transport protein A [Spirochaetaceae bacterium]
MPLTLSKRGVTAEVNRIGGPEAIRKRLESMGFCAGTIVTIVSELDGNLIVGVKESRVALSRELASKIFVSDAA